MATEWITARIEDVAEKVAIGPFGSSIKVETFVPEGIPVISGQHLHGIRLADTEYNFVTYEHAEKLRNANVFRGDVIFTHAGNIGQAAYIPQTSKYDRYIISQRQFYMRCDKSKVIPEFVAYFFRTPEGQHQLLANVSSVGVPSIAQPVTYLRTIEIPIPPVAEQRAIAGMLGALDDKIELNRQMNKPERSLKTHIVMPTTQQDIESRLSYAYLHAVASHAGFVCRPATPDEDKEGIDAVLTAYGTFPGTWRTQVTVNVQLKATVSVPADDGTHFSYFVDGIRRYDELRKDHREPVRILLVLFLPAQHVDWLTCSENELILKRCAYWASLRNAPVSPNGTGQTVKIPKVQSFMPEHLKALVQRLALGTDIPCYLVP